MNTEIYKVFLSNYWSVVNDNDSRSLFLNSAIPRRVDSIGDETFFVYQPLYYPQFDLCVQIKEVVASLETSEKRVLYRELNIYEPNEPNKKPPYDMMGISKDVHILTDLSFSDESLRVNGVSLSFELLTSGEIKTIKTPSNYGIEFNFVRRTTAFIGPNPTAKGFSTWWQSHSKDTITKSSDFVRQLNKEASVNPVLNSISTLLNLPFVLGKSWSAFIGVMHGFTKHERFAVFVQDEQFKDYLTDRLTVSKQPIDFIEKDFFGSFIVNLDGASNAWAAIGLNQSIANQVGFFKPDHFYSGSLWGVIKRRDILRKFTKANGELNNADIETIIKLTQPSSDEFELTEEVGLLLYLCNEGYRLNELNYYFERLLKKEGIPFSEGVQSLCRYLCLCKLMKGYYEGQRFPKALSIQLRAVYRVFSRVPEGMKDVAYNQRNIDKTQQPDLYQNAVEMASVLVHSEPGYKVEMLSPKEYSNNSLFAISRNQTRLMFNSSTSKTSTMLYIEGALVVDTSASLSGSDRTKFIEWCEKKNLLYR